MVLSAYINNEPLSVGITQQSSFNFGSFILCLYVAIYVQFDAFHMYIRTYVLWVLFRFVLSTFLIYPISMKNFVALLDMVYAKEEYKATRKNRGHCSDKIGNLLVYSIYFHFFCISSLQPEQYNILKIIDLFPVYNWLSQTLECVCFFKKRI